MNAKQPIFYNNLGNILRKFGNNKDSETCLKNAITLNPNEPIFYNNLVLTLINQDKFSEAETFINKAIILNPNHPVFLNTLGITLQNLKKFQQAEVIYKRVIKMMPKYTEAINNLGTVLDKLNKIDEAEELYRKAICLNSSYSKPKMNLSIILDYKHRKKEMLSLLEEILVIDKEEIGFKAMVHIGIVKFLEKDLNKSKDLILSANLIHEKKNSEYINDKVYQKYLLKLIEWHNKNIYPTQFCNTQKKMFVIGDSHTLSSHMLNIKISNKNYLCEAFLIKGCKQWHLGSNINNRYKLKFKKVLGNLPESSEILISCGEIDCRLDSWICNQLKCSSREEIKNHIIILIKNFVSYLKKVNKIKSHRITLQGIPCPNINFNNYSQANVENLKYVIKTYNSELKRASKYNNFGYLDLYKLTNRGDGISNNHWHIDNFHLSPTAMLKAWKFYYPNI